MSKNTKNEIKLLWTLKEAAEEFGVPEGILRSFIKEGRIKAVKERCYSPDLIMLYDEYYLDYFAMLELRRILAQLGENENTGENEAGVREGGLKGLDENPLSNTEKLLLPEILRAYKEEFRRALGKKVGLPFKVEVLISDEGHIDFYFGLDMKAGDGINTIIIDRIITSDDGKSISISQYQISNAPQEGLYGLNTIIEEALREKGIRMKRLRCLNLVWAYVSENIKRSVKEAITELY
jgi:hypothetical protein